MTSPTIRTGGLTASAAQRPDVLPTACLNRQGRLATEERAQLRRVPDARNALRVLWIWAQALALVGVAAWVGGVLVWIVAAVLMSRVIVLCNILTHEAVHGLLFSDRRVNDLVGRWLLSYPVLVPYDAYRRAHMAHHREAFGPHEPDLLLYGNYPTSRSSMWRKLRRDLFFVSGFKIGRGVLRALSSPTGRPVASRMLVAQVVLAIVFGVLGAWWAYAVVWLLSWLTVWRVVARLRAIAEHGGLERSDDQRAVCHHVRQGWLARGWLVPYNTGFHLAHHLDPALPYRSLPAFHRELERAGYLPASLVYPSYVSLWRRLASA